MKKKQMIKSAIVKVIALLMALTVMGCTGRTESYKYNVKNIEHCGFFYISGTTYYKDRVEFKIHSRYELKEMTFRTPDDPNATVGIDDFTLILYSSDPSKITSLDVFGTWYELSFRYLNSKEYACIWRTVATDIGWTDYKGNLDDYYNDAEKAQQKETEEKAEEQWQQTLKEDEEVFPLFQGKWVSDEGDYFEIYDTESEHGVRFYQHDYPYAEEYYNCLFSRSDQENIYTVTYPMGEWCPFLSFNIEYDGGDSFLYQEKEFVRAGEETEIQKSNRTREYFENLDKENSSLDKLVDELGPCGYAGSGVIYHIWRLNDGSEARVVFDSDGKIAMIVIGEGGNGEKIYKREY